MNSLEEKVEHKNYSNWDKLQNIVISGVAAVSIGMGIPFATRGHYLTGAIYASIAVLSAYARYQNYKHNNS